MEASLDFNPLRHLGSVVRILSALIDAMVADHFQEWRVLGALETAIMRESSDKDGLTRSQAEQIMARRGWKTVEDAYRAAGIPEKHFPVVDLVLFSNFPREPNENGELRQGGFSNREIAQYTNHPVRTVKLWIHDDILRLAKLDFGELD